jgi:glucosylceramidase
MFKSKLWLVKNGGRVAFLVVVLLAGMMAPANAILKAKWRYSSATTKWVPEAQLTIVPSATVANYVDLDTTAKYQIIDGWGGSPNEVGTNALSRLPARLQDSVVKLLFDTIMDGCKFNMIRLPLGCSDFSLGGYTLNDNANDTLMTRISIARDTGGTIKFTKNAMRHNPRLKVWGSPWSAPIWMKNNNNWWGGGANTDECAVMQTPKILTAYALYFSRAVSLYKGAGLPYFALSFQNEPRVCQPFPSTRWSGGTTMENFMRNYLYPRMHADHPDVELWTPTMNVADHTYFSPMLDDATTNIAAACFQYEGRDAIAWVHATYPRIKKYATELVCGGGDNQWAYAFNPTFTDVKFYTDNGASGAFQWNLILEKNGASGPMINFRQNCMITMDTVAMTITCQPQYYVLKHFSYYIRPGSQRIRLAGNYMANVVAAKNPVNGNLVAVIQNAGTAAQTVSVRFGTQMVTASLPALSFASFVIYDSLTTGIHQAVVSSENGPAGASVSFKVTGEKFILPSAYAGKTCMCSVFDIKGKLIRKLSTKDQTIRLSKFGIPEGVYVVKVKTTL